MTPYDHASDFYSRSPYKSGHLTRLLNRHLQGGVVISTPRLFLMAEVRKWHDLIIGSDSKSHYWFIEYLSGSMSDALTLMPLWLPYVAFTRRGRMKVYATATLVNKILAYESIEDGHANPLLRRRWRGKSEASSSTSPDGCSGEFGEGEAFRTPATSPWLRI